jgi:intracellular multiplication protein IcmK
MKIRNILLGVMTAVLWTTVFADPLIQGPTADVNTQTAVAPTTTNSDQGSTLPPPGTKLPSLPKLPNVGQASFQAVVDQVAPLTPEQIKALRKKIDDSERAAATLPRFVPKPVSSPVTVSLMPGETPPVVRLFANYVTNILFVDSVGNPLIVTDVDVGGAASFTVTYDQKAKDDGSNLVKISPQSDYASGNISVSLDGVRSPVTLTLVSGQREVDYRVDVRVRGVGRIGPASSLPSSSNPIMVNMLEGLAPDGAKTLTTSTSEVQAWEVNGHFYVRTSYSLLSPAYLSEMKSADGGAVYEIAPTPVIVALSGGNTVQINISGY